nr:reverse transcriptase domain-containing protein [Tanacetum cinerariifolium]
MDKIRCDKRKRVHARLDFGETSKKSQRVREGSQNLSVGTLPTRQSAFDRLSDTYSPSITKSSPDRANSRNRSHSKGRSCKRDSSPSRSRPQSRDRLRGTKESYVNTCSFYRIGARHRYYSHDRDRSRSMKRGKESESPLSRESESGSMEEGHWKSKSKRRKPIGEEDLAVPWSCEEVDLFTPRIRNFKSSRKTRMPNNVKTYDGTGDPNDHIKIFQAAAQVERWAMPHMFNFTLIGTARVWFDKLPLESIDGYKDLKASFLAYFMLQKKYVKDPVEIYRIKQRDGETIEDFLKRFKLETGCMKGTPKYMRIFRFMHGVNKPELTKRLNKHVPNTMEEMMTATTAFIRGETIAASKKKCQPKEGRGSNRFTPLPEHLKKSSWPNREVQTATTHGNPVEKRSSNKFYDFHNDKGYITDECVQLKKQIEELVRAGKLSNLIKDIKQGRDQLKLGKKEVLTKDKSLAIYMVQSWHRMARQKVTQSFAHVIEMTFPPLATSRGTEGPLVIEAKIGGHMIHRMYVDEAHKMRKFSVDGGIVTIRSTILIPTDYAVVTTTSKEILKEAEPFDMKGVPLSVAEQRLNIQEGYSPVRQKKRGQASKRVIAIQVELKDVRGFHEFKQGLSAGLLPLSEIDRKVESLYGYPFKCFLDAYKGYHQIQMAESDEEKMAFHTSHGVNPKKCMFEAVEGMFLGYMISPKGIKPCPDKTEAMLRLPSPRTIKEVRSLNGKFASLNRFLSKLVEKSLPLFKTLKKCIKKSDFHWTPEAKQVFKQLKQHLSELLMLVAPKPKKELIVYLSASRRAISAILMTERDTV